MTFSATDMLAACAAISAVWMCGVTSLRLQILGLAAQTSLLAGLCVALEVGSEAGEGLVLAATVLLVKAVAIPALLLWSVRRLGVRRDAGATAGPTAALFLACGILFAGSLVGARIAVPEALCATSAGMALALVLTGMLLMIVRRLALSQVLGFLVIENGIFLYGLTQARGMPLLVEMGVAFEVLVAVMLAGLVIRQLDRSFAHTDVTQLRGLRH